MNCSLRLALALGFVVALPMATTAGCFLGREGACATDKDCVEGTECTPEGCLPKLCKSDADCGESTSCMTFACVDKACTAIPKDATTPLADDAAGDCKVPQCDGKGAVVHVPAASDLPASADACTSYTCSDQGEPLPSYTTSGEPCDGGVCDGMGKCVACAEDADCGSGNYCHENACASCTDGAQNGDETGLDCGGSHCLKCNGDACSGPAECKSASCAGAGKCGWPAGVPCTSNDQCASLTCDNGACTAP